MMPIAEMTFEERVEREITEIRRDLGFMVQAQRLFAQVLGVRDQFEALASSFEHRYPTDPGSEPAE